MMMPIPLTGTYSTGASALRDFTGGSQVSSNDVTGSRSSSMSPATVIDLSATDKAVSSAASSTKDFATVAKDARSTLDAGYAKSGKISSIYTTGAEWTELFSGLDRRSLYAIKSNKDGQFSAIEQDIAKTEMGERLKNETGMQRYYNNIDLPFAPALKNKISYLDNVSQEEKQSFDWAVDRASTQSDYEARSRFEGQEPEKLDSTNPLVKMIKAAFDSLKELGDPSKQVEDMPQYKQAQQFFASQQAGASPALDIKA